MIPFDVATVPLSGMSLVEASAGTGKTHAIATLYLRLLVEAGAKVDQILVVTFTEAATSELRERIRARLGTAAAHCAASGTRSEPMSTAGTDDFAFLAAAPGGLERAGALLANALHDFDEAQISTIHGFCQRMLQDHAFESDVPFDAELLEDLKPLIEEIARDYWARETWGTDADFARWVSQHFSLETARRLARKASAHASLVLLPDPAGTPVSDDRAFRAAHARVKVLWDRSAATALMSQLKGQYRRYADKWCATLDAYLSDHQPLPNPPDALQHFRSEKVAKNSPLGAPRSPLFSACDDLAEAAAEYAAALDRRLLQFKRGWLVYLTNELDRRKARRGLLSFDDLLRRLHAALCAPSGGALLRGMTQRYRAALIDEFQDTDGVQYGIFERLCGGGNLVTFLIGDPKQAIYSFRGADVFTYMQAVRARPATQRYTMTTNYRSDPSLVRAVTRLFRRAQHPFLLADIGCPDVGARPEAVDSFLRRDGTTRAGLDLVFVDSRAFTGHGPLNKDTAERVLAALAAAEIAALLARGDTIDGQPVSARSIAVLTRTNLQAFAVQAALRRLGIYGVVIGDRSVYLSDEARELQLVLSAVLEPNNRRNLRAALSTELLGKTADDLERLGGDEAAWDEIVANFRRYNAVWTNHNFVQMLHALMRDAQVEERLLGLRDGERRMTNLLHLLELLHAAGRTQHLGPHALAHYLAEQRRSDTFAPDSEQIRLESDRDAVTLTTIHKSKGLEYPVVFCPFAALDLLLSKEDGKAPVFHQETDGACALDLGSSALEVHREINEREQFSENLRLLYVALTRARHHVSVFWGRYAGFDASALGYLLFPPADSGFPLGTRALSARLKDLDEEATYRAVEALNHPAEIAVRRVTSIATVPTVVRAEAATEPLSCRVPLHAVDSRYRTSSFTSFTREHRAHVAEPAAGRDWDDQVDEEPSAPFDTSTPGSLRALSTPIALREFPRGARAGNFFHELFEHADFSKIDGGLIRATLRSYGYDLVHSAAVEHALAQVVATPLPPTPSLSLEQVSRSRRLNELEFFLPVHPRTVSGDGGFDPRALARVFADHPSAELPEHYASALEALAFLPLRGFVRGFIDLVFEHEGRYYIVDYKTNHLGDQLLDYRPSRISDAMVSGHYFLQYHLYTLAVHRYLGRRLRHYDYERCFGGVLYLFVKGMTPESGANSGIFFERPPHARLTALSSALKGPI